MAATLSSVVWAIGVGAVIIAVVVAIVLLVLVPRRRTKVGADTPTTPAVDAPPVEAPMTGLEAALSQVTDRSGRPLREHIDAEQQHVDELRVPDDTGPLLRRALDHVEQPGSARDGVPDPPSRGTD